MFIVEILDETSAVLIPHKWVPDSDDESDQMDDGRDFEMDTTPVTPPKVKEEVKENKTKKKRKKKKKKANNSKGAILGECFSFKKFARLVH